MVKQNVGLTLQSSIVEPLKRDMPYLTARTVAKMLNKLGLKVVRHLETNKLFTTKEQLIKVAKDIGYEDEVGISE
jgi:arginine repressor